MPGAFIAGFTSELLEKQAVLGTLVKALPTDVKLMAAMGGYSAAEGGIEGFKRGISGDKPRFLQASKFGPSAAFYTNYHDDMPHENTPHQNRALSRSYHENAFKRGG